MHVSFLKKEKKKKKLLVFSSHFIAAPPASSKLLSCLNKSGERLNLNRRGRASSRQALDCAETRRRWGQARSNQRAGNWLRTNSLEILSVIAAEVLGRGGGHNQLGMSSPSSVQSLSHLAPLS